MTDEQLSAQARSIVLVAYGDPGAAPSLERLTIAMSRLDERVQTLIRLQVAASTAPDVGDVEQACAALRFAASVQVVAERAADTLAADRIQFLETSLEFHARHGTQPCPVCASSTLDDEWVVRARSALGAEKDAASALRVARSGSHRARQALTALVRAVEAPSPEDVELPAVATARVAYQLFSDLSTDDGEALADGVARELPGLRAAYGALGDEATAALEIAREAQTWLQTLAPGVQP